MSSIEKAMAQLAATTNVSQKQNVVALEASLPKKESVKPQITLKSKPKISLNLKALEKARYLTPNTMQDSLADEYRLLKRKLLLNAHDTEKTSALSKHKNLIAITSALLGEGKTFTAFNLAMSIAMEWNTTVQLIDCDLTRRSLTALVGLINAPGLTDVLLDEQLDLSHVIVSTNVDKLRFIPAGRIHRDATELLTSKRMQHLTNELSERYSDRVILFDTPPLLANSQALPLTSLAGQTLVVIEEGKTPQKAIKQAISLLDKNKSIGIVLNKCYRKSSSSYY